MIRGIKAKQPEGKGRNELAQKDVGKRDLKESARKEEEHSGNSPRINRYNARYNARS